MPDVDVYCGNFTNNKLSDSAKNWFNKYNVNVIDEQKFYDIGPQDSYMFLRTFTKDFFAKKLLDDYDYIVCLDVDVIALKPFEFDFNPLSPIVLVQTIPQWGRNYHAEHLVDFTGNLYYNWVDIINQHNRYIFELDWTDPYVLHKHNADKITSNKIDQSCLTIMEQDIGGYHCLTHLKQHHLMYHYDAFKESGSLYNLKPLFFNDYQKYMRILKTILNVDVTNQEGYWENIIKEYS